MTGSSWEDQFWKQLRQRKLDSIHSDGSKFSFVSEVHSSAVRSHKRPLTSSRETVTLSSTSPACFVSPDIAALGKPGAVSFEGILMRFGAYVDGFNLFYSLKRMRRRDLYWLNLESLMQALVPVGSSLEFVNFYTSPSLETSSNRGIRARQELYWKALGSTSKVRIIQGKIVHREMWCLAHCKGRFTKWQEKETDVKLGLDIVRDSLTGVVDGIILVTGDTDQIPTLKMLAENCPSVSRRLFLPPSTEHFPRELTSAATFHGSIREGKLKDSNFQTRSALPMVEPLRGRLSGARGTKLCQ